MLFSMYSSSSIPLLSLQKIENKLLNLTVSVSCNPFSGFMILMYIFETYLDVRQHAALKLPTLPKSLEGVISQEKFEKSRAYSLDKRFAHFFCHADFFHWMMVAHSQGCLWEFFLNYNVLLSVLRMTFFPLFSHFHFIHEFVTILTDSTILYFGVLPWFWKVRIWCSVCEVWPIFSIVKFLFDVY